MSYDNADTARLCLHLFYSQRIKRDVFVDYTLLFGLIDESNNYEEAAGECPTTAYLG
jgi:hypothetical protein